MARTLAPEWTEGELRGVRVRGGVELDLRWSGGKLSTVVWRCTKSGPFELRLPQGQQLRSFAANGHTLTVSAAKDHVTRLEMTQGTPYTLSF